ncbi:MAG TPA: RHS repeat-associated core domain-containing protein, partial [Anaerolineales bacterium]|nr:RHS repeat-associated core domain-containing protein [Anaerolineales bacterium]
VQNKKGAATITSHAYTMDNVGNRTQVVENIGTSTYGYDNLYRLTSVTYWDSVSQSYTYSPTGNRLTKVQGGTTNYTYDEADQLLSDGQFSNYEWDNNGNMDSRGTQSYGYDPANQLNDAEIGGQTTSYIYNGDGVRTARETSSTYTEYVIDHNRSLPVVLYDESAFYVWGLDLIARIVGSTQQYYHYDGLGSTRALTGNTGTTLATYNYDVFGAIRSQTGSQTNNFLFTGEWRDPETGFYFLRARYYDPVVGRFINRDPFSGFVGDPLSLNRYTYALQNPVNLVDPSGLCVPFCFPLPVVAPELIAAATLATAAVIAYVQSNQDEIQAIGQRVEEMAGLLLSKKDGKSENSRLKAIKSFLEKWKEHRDERQRISGYDQVIDTHMRAAYNNARKEYERLGTNGKRLGDELFGRYGAPLPAFIPLLLGPKGGEQ